MELDGLCPGGRRRVLGLPAEPRRCARICPWGRGGKATTTSHSGGGTADSKSLLTYMSRLARGRVEHN